VIQNSIVYLDTLHFVLNKLQKVAEIAYKPSLPEIDKKLLLPSITLGTQSEYFMTKSTFHNAS